MKHKHDDARVRGNGREHLRERVCVCVCGRNKEQESFYVCLWTALEHEIENKHNDDDVDKIGVFVCVPLNEFAYKTQCDDDVDVNVDRPHATHTDGFIYTFI